MGLFSGLKAMKKVEKIKAGGKELLSIADITNLIINLPDAKRNLSSNQFSAVHSLFQYLQKCRTNMELDLTGYYEEAAIIIGIFNQIAPYEKYSGMEQTEALFFMNGIKPLLDELKPRSEALLNSIKVSCPELNKYFSLKTQDIELLLTEMVNSRKAKEDDDYINYLMQNCHFLKREHATAFYGVLIANALYGKNKALDLMDQLFLKWINSETHESINRLMEERIYDPQSKIAFFCGVLFPNGVVTKEESDRLSKTYTDLWISRATVTAESFPRTAADRLGRIHSTTARTNSDTAIFSPVFMGPISASCSLA